ncbi:rho GTPase activating protein at 100F isoform X2 [Haematobia irritans]|uniref:rho GTPase activating protein at 100F isoform X2 n=1 Tax=Haematobia irritans TaxID=7368 RepID=UPI003F501C99
MQWKKKFTRLKAATGHSRARRMLCCGRRKENGRSVPDVTASPGRAPPGPLPSNQMQTMVNQQQQQQHHHQQQQSQHQQHHQQRQGGSKEPVLLQGDFRKVSGISSEIFRQIEAVENDHDPNTAAALEAVERRGEMIVRILEPHSIGGKQAVDAAHKLLAKKDNRHIVQLVEIVKRPGQTLGLYIREGNGADRTDGVFISRIAIESAVSNSGCLKVGDEILAVNLVDVTHMSLDDVVIIMSIPRRLVLAIRQRCGNRGTGSPGPPSMSRPEQKPPPVVVMKRDLRDEELDETDHMSRSRSSRERRTGDGREMSESRSRLGLGLNNYSPQSEQLDMYYNTRPGMDPPNWGYKPPPPPSSVITEQPKGHTFAPSHAYYKNAGTLESLAEKVHSFYPGAPPSRRLSVGNVPQRARFPRSGSDQHLPRVEYADYSNSLGRHSLLRPSLKPSGGSVIMGPGGTLGRYGRYDPHSQGKYGPSGTQSLTRRSRPNLDYSSDTEATVGPRPNYYYYNRPAIGSMPRGGGAGGTSVLGGGPDMAKFNSLPRDRPGVRLPGIRSRISDRIMDENDGNISAPEFNARRDRDLRSRINASPSIFTSDEYRAWLRRAPSSSAIAEQMRMTRDLLNQPRSHRFSCSAENIHDALRNTESIYSSRTGILGAGTLDRHLGMPRPISSLPVRSMSSQHIGGPNSIRSPSIRRMRQLLELSAGPASPSGSIMSTGGHQSPAPTPSATLPRPHRQIDINPAEFSKYKLDKPIVDIGGVSGMLWIHLLAGRGLRSAPELGPQHGAGGQHLPAPTRDLYCVIECDRVHKARTVVRSGDLQFDWDESFELDLVGNKQLDVLVYSWDPQHRHKLCYRGAISLSTVLRQSPLHQLALKVEPRGTIYIRMRHTDPIALYKRRGLPSLRAGYPTLFGADLESVVNRESKGAPGSAPVPIVLRRCVEEVERRGLDIIGLYRLCGSATKKRLLREAFERNSRAVELTPEHVPDINVITGVLKDYLRELPEPLFTRCLFQMTVDALAVCLPDDPEGNAKLMLSILDCLPRANRATLVFLLDHLSLVVSNSERNKMSAQALATVMGPPLMLHSASAQPGSDIDHAQPIAVLKYLLQIWPQPQAQHHQSTAVVGAGNLMGSMTVGGSAMGMGLGMGLGMSAGSMNNMAGVVSGRRGESTGQRGSKVNALQVDRQAFLMQQQQQLMAAGNLLRSSTSPHPLVDSVVSAIPDPSPLPIPGTPSPGSSSASTASGSGSGKSTDTIKRGISPASVKQVNIQESVSSYSLSQKKSDRDSLDTNIITTTTNHLNSHNHQNHHHHNHHSNINNNINNNNTNQHHQQQQQTLSGTSGTAAHASSTTRKGVDFYEPHKSQTKSDDDNNGVVSNSSGIGSSSSSKYGDSAYKLRSAYASSGGSSAAEHKTSSALSTEEYKAMRNKSSATSSSSSSQATVLSAGSAGTSATTTSSDDSDDLVSYKSSASTNALLAQSQAMTTTQLMSKYLKREPRVQFTPIKSPDSPSPPGGSGLPRGTYHLTNSSRNIHGDLGSSSTSGTTTATGTGKYSLDKSDKAASPTKPALSSLKEPAMSSGSAISPGSSSTVSTGRRLFDSLASELSESSSATGRSRSATSTTTSYNNDIRHSVASSSTHISNKSTSSEHRSFGSSLFSSIERSSAPYSSNGSNGSAHYGTLPKQSISGATLFNTGASAASSTAATSSAAGASSTASGTASSSGVSSMSGSTSSYDFYPNNSSAGYSGSSVYATTSRSYANGTSNGSSATTSTSGAGNYHTLGTYRVQYAATNPFLDAFDAPSESITRSGSSSTSSSSEHRSSAMAAFAAGGSESKNGSDEYDDLK